MRSKVCEPPSSENPPPPAYTLQSRSQHRRTFNKFFVLSALEGLHVVRRLYQMSNISTNISMEKII